jgi:isoaspartyl peptidase/L-asparaginase-like protein (Ntn-hydrolase superfamily)
MEQTDHAFLVGEEAEKFAESMGVPIVPTDCLIAKNITRETDNFSKIKAPRFEIEIYII